MTSDDKILKLVDITTGTNVDAGQLATLLAILGKLSRGDVTKAIWAAIGTANALSYVKKSHEFEENKQKNSAGVSAPIERK